MKTLALFILLICLTAKANPVLFQWTPATNATGCVLLEGVQSNNFVGLYVAGVSNGVVQEAAFPIGTTFWAVAVYGSVATDAFIKLDPTNQIVITYASTTPTLFTNQW